MILNGSGKRTVLGMFNGFQVAQDVRVTSVLA